MLIDSWGAYATSLLGKVTPGHIAEMPPATRRMLAFQVCRLAEILTEHYEGEATEEGATGPSPFDSEARP